MQLPRPVDDDALRQQAWDFMKMQTGQRLQSFNFYVVICLALTAALASSLKTGDLNPLGASAAGVMLVFLSFIFFKLDLRNRDLIRSAESALKVFEQSSLLPDQEGVPHPAKRFLKEEYDTQQQRNRRTPLFWRRHFGYTECFRSVFCCFAAVGIAGIVAALLL